MQNRKQLIFGVIAWATVTVMMAQNATFSPYSRYGYGQLANSSFGAARAMGGASIGMRDNNRINTANPASYSAIDSTTFLFDFGVSGQIATYTENGIQEKKQVGNIEYMAMQFPLAKHMGASVGLIPYSYIGYQFGQVNAGGANATYAYTGEGGFSQAYFGIAATPFKNFSLGVNFNYLFGTTNNYSTITSGSSGTFATTQQLHARGLKADLGLQWTKKIDKEQNFCIGLTYTPKTKLNTEVLNIRSIAGISDSTHTNQNYELAETYGIGIGWQLNNKWTIAADGLYQRWSDALYYSKKDSLTNRFKVSAGAEYTPNINGRHYYEHVKYRFGGYVSNNYLNIKGQKLSEYGISAGIGLPFKSTKSILNITVDYSQITPQYNLIKENSLKLTLNLTFNEFWFFKRKID
jgi:hypothetical protein